jgi:hypothetical protein
MYGVRKEEVDGTVQGEEMRLEFVPETLNKVVYQLQTAEQELQNAKDIYEVLEEQQKDLLASLSNQIAIESDVSQVKAESLARSTQDWKNFREGLFQAKKAFGEKKVRYNHLVRVMDCVINSMSYNKELLRKGLSGEVGK